MTAGEPASRRGPGRPRAGDAGHTREAIVSAARRRFAAEGFDRTSLRSIAADAGVDASLISHYFGDKAGLLVATMQLPVNPIALIRPLVEQGPDGLAERILRTFLTAWDPHPDVISGLLRTTVASQAKSAPLLEFLRTAVLGSLVEVIRGEDRELRATLLISQLVGIATLRYVLRFEPIAVAAPDEIVRRYAPVMQALITG